MYTYQQFMNDLRATQMDVHKNMKLYHSTKEEVARDLYYNLWCEAEGRLLFLADIARSSEARDFIIANSDADD